jgi:hypothetical protein
MEDWNQFGETTGHRCATALLPRSFADLSPGSRGYRKPYHFRYDDFHFRGCRRALSTPFAIRRFHGGRTLRLGGIERHIIACGDRALKESRADIEACLKHLRCDLAVDMDTLFTKDAARQTVTRLVAIADPVSPPKDRRMRRRGDIHLMAWPH